MHVEQTDLQSHTVAYILNHTKCCVLKGRPSTYNNPSSTTFEHAIETSSIGPAPHEEAEVWLRTRIISSWRGETRVDPPTAHVLHSTLQPIDRSPSRPPGCSRWVLTSVLANGSMSPAQCACEKCNPYSGFHQLSPRISRKFALGLNRDRTRDLLNRHIFKFETITTTPRI